MAQETFTIRMDADTKRDFGKLCASIGMTMSTAISVYAKKAVSEQRIPFELTANNKPIKAETETQRIGVAKGKLRVPAQFKEWDKEVEELFDEGEL